MSSRDTQTLINELSKTSATRQPLTITRGGRPIATVVSIEDFREFEAEREKRLNSLKIELDNILALVRSRLKNRLSPAELEAQLEAHRQNISKK